MNALHVFWKYTTVKDKFLIAAVGVSPLLVVLHALDIQSRGLLPKGFWPMSAFLFFFIFIVVFALRYGMYREAKKAKVLLIRIKTGL